MSEKTEKTISFVVPVYNDGDSIEKMVKSIIDQDLPNIEIIAVNDGSTDDSLKVLNGLKDSGMIDVLVNFEKNEGACRARNEGAKRAKGKYLSFLPADAVLYPGAARIWYDHLEENPDYDFLYGGYQFIDEDGEPVAGENIMGQPFDPYLLEVTNYIDGSFPIKADSFWKYAKIVNQPEGLWDPHIKSLQDWDFWLSVVKNGGKGIYVQDIFFGTTFPHPGGLSYDSAANWLERTEAIKKKHGIPIRKICVASLGAGWHGRRIAYLLGADFKEMPSFKAHRYDAIYVIGFYPEFASQQDKMFFNNLYNDKDGRTAAKKIVHFVGTDIWQLYHVSTIGLEQIWIPYLKNNVDEVLCEAEFTRLELEKLGIHAKVVPIPPAKLYETRPLPKDFTVACYQPLINSEFYRPKEMYEIAKKLPDVKFKFFGNPKKVGNDPALPANIEFCGYINDMNAFISECSGIMRFPVHDGMPLSVLEFILAGRYSVQTVPIDYSFSISTKDFTIDRAVELIQEMRKKSEGGINQEGSDYWRKELDHDLYRERIHKLASYNPKEYWENRALAWSKQAENQPIESSDVKDFILRNPHKSVLDIGCGDGRWYQLLQEWGVERYIGVDISANLIKAARLRFPNGNFIESSVETLETKLVGEEKFDLIFSYTCLEHVKEEHFGKAIEAMKNIGKKALLIEPPGSKNQSFISRYYCHRHDYSSLNVLEKKELDDKTIYLIDLDA